ncbi:MAG: sodium/solute symporter [Rubrivivax sp.]|nr:sodium/solute symporter [Rubrivivax sp.]
MSGLDLAVIAGYLLLTLGVGALATRRSRRSRHAGGADDYFLGARDLPAWAVMLSVVATETSALTVISVPGIAARGDFTFLQLAFGYLLGRIVVAAWLLPGYVDGTQQTAYQRLEARFGAPVRRALAAVFLATRFLADGVRIFAGAIPLALVTGWDVALSIVAMGGVTLLYTFTGGLRAVVWADVLQLAVYVAGGVAALYVALQLVGDPAVAWARAAEAGKLRLFDFSLDARFGFFAGLLGGALLSAASHGTDHIVVQRLLATRSLRDARVALVGSGVLVIAQFALFLAVGTALWAAGHAPAGTPGDELFPRFVITQLPAGLAGLVIAGILAAAMSTISSSISAMASSFTYDLYASWRGRDRDAAHLLQMGRWFSLLWGLLLIGGALGFHAFASGRDTPVVVLALSIASVTYGALLGSYVLAGTKVLGRDVITGATVSVVVMLGLVMGAKLSFLWTVPLGTALTVLVALARAALSGPQNPPA